MNKTKSTAFLGVCVALALVLAYIEAILPPIFPAIPGIKVGLPNIIIIFLLYKKGPVSAIAVSLLRILLQCLLFGNAVSLAYSLAGGIISIFVMIILLKTNIFSIVGVSVAGGVAHNIGQILMAMLLLETSELFYYLAVLVVTGTVAGVLIGLCGSLLIKHIPEKVIK
ncbi:MAG: Gx transporter family protein [Clostridia bacterium]|nr:Gx transporter family protein [Clostridia bacterium]